MRRIVRPAAAAALVLAAALSVPTADARPIPGSTGPGEPKAFLGEPRPARPATFGPEAPRHPYMATNGRSNIHDDAYQSDAYPGPGPLGYEPRVTSTLLARECASVTFDRRGRIVTVCVGVEGPVLHLMHPRTLESLASYRLPARQPDTVPTLFSSFGGGGYFYLDHRDRAIIPTMNGRIHVVVHRDGAFERVGNYDLRDRVGDSAIVSALPDWEGRLWFVTLDGLVGVVRRSDGRVRTLRLDEGIGNSFAVDERGAVYVVTDLALYRFDARDGRPSITWRKPYDRGSRIKPGQTEHGSGTTPTIVRRDGRHFVAITDNADPRMHVLVYRAGQQAPKRPFCKVPVFAADRSATDNSLIAVGKAIVVENNYGYSGPAERPPRNPYRVTPTTEPGVARIDVDYDERTCVKRWENRDVRVPSVVPKASAATGLVYVYEHPAADEISYEGTPPPDQFAADPWYLTALDLRTGKRVWSRLVGNGFGFNNNYAPITLGPDGTAYVGVLGGLVAVRDTTGPLAE